MTPIRWLAHRDRLLMVTEFAKQPMTRAFRIVLIQDIKTMRCDVFTEYKAHDGKGWDRQDGAYMLTPKQDVSEFLRRVESRAIYYGQNGAADRVEAPVPG